MLLEYFDLLYSCTDRREGKLENWFLKMFPRCSFPCSAGHFAKPISPEEFGWKNTAHAGLNPTGASRNGILCFKADLPPQDTFVSTWKCFGVSDCRGGMWGLVCARENQTQQNTGLLFPTAALCVTPHSPKTLQNKKAIECHRVGKAEPTLGPKPAPQAAQVWCGAGNTPVQAPPEQQC